MKHSKILYFAMVWFPCLQLVWTILLILKIIQLPGWLVLLVANIILSSDYRQRYKIAKKAEALE